MSIKTVTTETYKVDGLTFSSKLEATLYDEFRPPADVCHTFMSMVQSNWDDCQYDDETAREHAFGWLRHLEGPLQEILDYYDV